MVSKIEAVMVSTALGDRGKPCVWQGSWLLGFCDSAFARDLRTLVQVHRLCWDILERSPTQLYSMGRSACVDDAEKYVAEKYVDRRRGRQSECTNSSRSLYFILQRWRDYGGQGNFSSHAL
jgi:hypothetical protein